MIIQSLRRTRGPSTYLALINNITSEACIWIYCLSYFSTVEQKTIPPTDWGHTFSFLKDLDFPLIKKRFRKFILKIPLKQNYLVQSAINCEPWTLWFIKIKLYYTDSGESLTTLIMAHKLRKLTTENGRGDAKDKIRYITIYYKTLV